MIIYAQLKYCSLLQEDFSSLSMLKLLTLSNVIYCVVVLYIAFVAKKLYQLVNPLSGIDIVGRTDLIEPLWKQGERFDIICYFSTSTRFKSINTTALRSEGRILFEKGELQHSSVQKEMDIKLNLVIPSAAKQPTQENYIQYSPPQKFWQLIHNNATTIYLHVLISRSQYVDKEVVKASHISSGDSLHGVVGLIKTDRIPKHFKHRYLLSDFGLVDVSTEEALKLNLPPDTVITYWKPEVTVKLVNDFNRYPYEYLPEAIYRNVIIDPDRSAKKARTMLYKPAIHVDEIGLTSDKYVPLNSTITHLPLRISISPLSVQRWLLMDSLGDALNSQKDIGFTDKDIDDVRRLISETSIYLLGVTLLASLMHLLFEFLAFKSDISFWQHNKSLAGLSTRSVVTELISQTIVFLFLIDSDTSLLIIVPALFGIIIQSWKVYKATGLVVIFSKFGIPTIEFERWKSISATIGKTEKAFLDSAQDQPQSSVDALSLVTLEADKFATTYLSAALIPLVVVFILRSLVFERHLTWYSWAIGALTSCVYTFGFILMCPQLYINHRLQSVSHLPWKFLVYKFLNTFIDDLFAFIIKMPTMHRLSVFRDDIVFVIYLYQRWIYRVDESRPIEK